MVGWPARVGAFALEATTGWRYVVEDLLAAGFDAHMAEPADTAALRGQKRRARPTSVTPVSCASCWRWAGSPESWIPPAHIADLRETVRFWKKLVDECNCRQPRMHAVLYNAGLPKPDGGLLTRESRRWLAGVDMPAASEQSSRLGCVRSTVWRPSWHRSTGGCALRRQRQPPTDRLQEPEKSVATDSAEAHALPLAGRLWVPVRSEKCETFHSLVGPGLTGGA